VTVTNSGKYSSDEVVQLYFTHLPAQEDIPRYSLEGFQRIHLKPGEKKEINFSVTPDMMQLVNEKGEHVLHAGKIKISIAGSLPSKRSLELGASKPVDAILNIE
ncbi:MAG: fibronectin type III-like domain-contianing protein, partial [Chitinophagaceae bacterium]